MTQYQLADAEERNRTSNGGFEIPPATLRDNLQRGDFAKLVFMNVDHPVAKKFGERMWVQVTGRRGLLYEGTLNNSPTENFGLKCGDCLTFESKNVIDVITTGN